MQSLQRRRPGRRQDHPLIFTWDQKPRCIRCGVVLDVKCSKCADGHAQSPDGKRCHVCFVVSTHAVRA